MGAKEKRICALKRSWKLVQQSFDCHLEQLLPLAHGERRQPCAVACKREGEKQLVKE